MQGNRSSTPQKNAVSNTKFRLFNRVRPYAHDSTASRQLSEVKHVLAQLVLRWVTTLEPWELDIFVVWTRTGSVVGATPTLHTPTEGTLYCACSPSLHKSRSELTWVYANPE